MYSYYQTKAFYGTVIIKLGLFTVQLSSTQSFFCDPEEDVYKGNGHNNGRRVTEPWWLQHHIFIGINRVIYTWGLISQWEKRRGGVPANQGLVLLAVAG